jgi:hypothetical protein
MKKENIKVCPKCGSTNITIPGAGMDFEMSIKDLCQDCGERGNFPVIEESKLRSFQKKKSDKNKI